LSSDLNQLQSSRIFEKVTQKRACQMPVSVLPSRHKSEGQSFEHISGTGARFQYVDK